MYVQLVGEAWVPARHPYQDAEGNKYDKIDQLNEKPGRLAAAGIHPAAFETPDDEDVTAWDTGTLAAGTVTFRPVESLPREPDVSVDQMARALQKTSLPEAIAALEAASPGLLAAALMLRLLGLSEATAMLSDLGAVDVPAAAQIRQVAVAEKAADAPPVKGTR
ncbi:hypothetical protein [uncultured Zoogloea sp.]|uniref:hypothetical protein n=1 Tax=uncultured Zoogloea sp. TaxID=160237 RepID=UPI00263426D2|nr:hypothetical protein [uncultured Zoogloea sp.]